MGSSCVSGMAALLPVMVLHRKTFDAMVEESGGESVSPGVPSALSLVQNDYLH